MLEPGPQSQDPAPAPLDDVILVYLETAVLGSLRLVQNDNMVKKSCVNSEIDQNNLFLF